jgi:small GTP-binding protein
MGHGGVGKTSFINRYIHNDFAETVSTIGASFVLKKWKTFYFGIWDTAGQERFTKISSYYCRGAQAAILAYDITDRESFQSLDTYTRFLADADRDCAIVVIGTKHDLSAERRVSEEEGQQYARQHSGTFYETSAKDNWNVTQVFDRLGYQCFAGKMSSEEMPGSTATLDLGNSRMVVAAAQPAAGADKTCCSVQ